LNHPEAEPFILN